MFEDQIEQVTVTATEARDHLAELKAERALAEVTEIATLRGELSGVQVG